MVFVCRYAGHWLAYIAGGGLVLILSLAAAPLPNSDKPPPEPVAKADTKNSETQHYGTTQTPFVIQQITPIRSQEEADQDKQDRNEKYSSDIWVIRLTGALVFIGTVQTIVFAVQANRLKATIRKMDEIAALQTGDMKAYIGEASNAAKAMQSVADAMVENNTVSIKSAIAHEKSALIAEESFRKIERPYLFVQDINFTFSLPDFGGPAQTNRSFQPFVNHVFKNFGRTPATITRGYRKLFISDKFPEFYLYEQNCLTVGEAIVTLGATVNLEKWYCNESIMPDEVMKIINGEKFLFFCGRIEYSDIFGTSYETGFGFSLNVKLSQIHTFGGEAYNYRK